MRAAAVVTVSDSCSSGQRVDLSGPAVAAELAAHGFDVKLRLLVADVQSAIEDALRTAAAQVAFVVTTGGTGIAARDVTPEATRAVCDRLIEGLPELMRLEGRKETRYAALSRGLCGTISLPPSEQQPGNRRHTQALVLNLPGSPRGAVSSLRAVLPLVHHALDLLAGNSDHPAGADPSAASDLATGGASR